MPAARRAVPRLVLAAALFACGGVSAWSADGGGASAGRNAHMGAAAIAAVNAARTEVGHGPLSYSPRLACTARRHAEDIAARGTLDHVGADGATLGVRLWRDGYRYARAAENLAKAGNDPRAVAALWAESPGHRRNMLNGGLTEAAVARVTAGGWAYWVMVMARPATISGARRDKAPRNAPQKTGISGNCGAIADDTQVITR